MARPYGRANVQPPRVLSPRWVRWLAATGLTVLIIVAAVSVATITVPERPNEVIPATTPTTLEPPSRATNDRPAQATVDESFTYDLIITGVPLRTGTNLTAPPSGRVEHGQRLNLECWMIGENITNGDPASTYDDDAQYTSDRWWYVNAGDAGEGFVSDVWLGRTAGDALGVPRCDHEGATINAP